MDVKTFALLGAIFCAAAGLGTFGYFMREAWRCAYGDLDYMRNSWYVPLMIGVLDLLIGGIGAVALLGITSLI